MYSLHFFLVLDVIKMLLIILKKEIIAERKKDVLLVLSKILNAH